ncbi:signal peptidase I [Streptomyces sp. PTM05]|uniref:Signal peptidase I n=1 Tax=Streptantibioticus parmotrematis TaxID=2873249 RepID=A0ABS7QZY1_9ACTN|nr:signal peptidase I [Streptantibioticus parmotrematis]MBY8888773.1 signal peptidase I [Streptantibioticus parmotrematis]
MGDLVVGARSGPGEPEGQGSSVGAVEEEAAVDLGKSPDEGGVPGPGGPADESGSGGSRHGGGSGGGSGKGAQAKPRSFWKELPILIVIALVLALIIKTFLVQAFSIPSDSMQNTLQQGDRVLVDKLTPWFGDKPSRGEVVVFHDPGGWLEGTPSTASSNPVIRGFQDVLSFIGLMPSANEKDLIKRVIAVGGDTVECKGTGPVYVNGKPLNEPYIYPGNTPCSDKPFGPIKIQPNHIWVMGDHRQDSLDSRYHQDLKGGGQVDDNQVVGRAIVIAWPINRWATLPIPSTFNQPGINTAMGLAPSAAGLAGAVPLVLWRRKRLVVKARKASATETSSEG